MLKKVGERERERERETSDSAKVCGLTGVCSVAKSTALRASEQLPLTLPFSSDHFSFQAKKIIIKTNYSWTVCVCKTIRVSIKIKLKEM